MALGHFIPRYESWDGLKLFFSHLSAPLNTEPLDARGTAASYKYFIEMSLLTDFFKKIFCVYVFEIVKI